MTNTPRSGGYEPSPGDPLSSGGRPNLAEEARQKTHQTKEAVKQGAKEMASEAKQEARRQVEDKKETAAQTLDDFAEAIRRAGEELSQRDQSFGSRLAQQAADGLAGLSRSLANKSPEQMLASAREFGRENPSAFFAASVLAGLALGRFAGASSRHGEDLSEEERSFAPTRTEGAVPTPATTADARPTGEEFNVVKARHTPPYVDSGSGGAERASPRGAGGSTVEGN